MRADLNEQYLERHRDAKAPDVKWLKVNGTAQADDFGLNERANLIVSKTAMEVLRRFRLDRCRVYKLEQVPTPEQYTEQLWEEARRAVKEARRDQNYRDIYTD